MDPPPLLGMAQDQSLERGVVGLRVEPDGLADVVGLDRGKRVLEAQDVSSVRLAPARGRHDRCTGVEREERKAAKASGRMAKELDHDAVLLARMLVEREYDEVPCIQPVEDRVYPATLG